jgi:hypothetical protein
VLALVADTNDEREGSRASACEHLSELGAVECLPHIEQAFADDRDDTAYVDFQTIRRQMTTG